MVNRRECFVNIQEVGYVEYIVRIKGDGLEIGYGEEEMNQGCGFGIMIMNYWFMFMLEYLSF